MLNLVSSNPMATKSGNRRMMRAKRERGGQVPEFLILIVACEKSPEIGCIVFIKRIENASSCRELISVEHDKLARVAGQFITPNGSQVYPVRLNGGTAYVTIPED